MNFEADFGGSRKWANFVADAARSWSELGTTEFRIRDKFGPLVE